MRQAPTMLSHLNPVDMSNKLLREVIALILKAQGPEMMSSAPRSLGGSAAPRRVYNIIALPGVFPPLSAQR